jgi:hypothetical protein
MWVVSRIFSAHPSAHLGSPWLTLAPGALPERSVSLTVAPLSTPILDPGGPLCRASLPISPGGPIGLFEVLSLGVMLPPTPFPFLPSTGRCDGGVPVLSAYKYRFPVVFSKSSSGYLSLLFPLLAAHCTLFLEVSATFCPLSTSPFRSFTPPQPSLLCPALWGNMGRASLVGYERRARDRTEAASTAPKSTHRSNLEPRFDTLLPPVSGSGMSRVLATLSCPSPPFPHVRSPF